MSIDHDQLVAWRHRLHQVPEIAFEEHDTAHFLAKELSGLGYDVVTGVGGTGVVATLTREGSTCSVGLRAEMDALAIEERTGFEHSSRNPGRMHACGHDGHMAMALGAAAALAGDDGWTGTLRILLQPAEEPGRGARAMVEDGLFERFPVDRLFGLHNLPGAPAGHLLTRPGALMASEDNFTIKVRGRGGHASAPHLVVDPLVVAAEIVTALQQVVARNVDPVHTAVLSCTDLVTDGARNAIPSNVTITGDTRSFDAGVQQLLEKRIRQISAGVAAAHGATVEVAYTHEFAVTVNDPDTTALAGSAATIALGVDATDLEAAPIMASEDFGVLAEQVPACFAFLGNGTEAGAGGTPLHSHDYAFNDQILASGVEFLRRVVLCSLAESSVTEY